MAQSHDAEREPLPTAWPDAFAADGGTGADLAAVDWEATPLGPPAQWPQSLLTAVDILLSSRFSMWMAWGPRLTFLCNAAYRSNTLGRKYPWALGRPASEVWAEIWPDIGPRIDQVLTTGEATWDEALLLFLERSGYPEETYHTFSYSPLRDDDGAVVGMLCVVSEDTERVIGERRMSTLRDLGSDPSVVRTEEEMLAFAGRQLGRNREDLPFTLTYLFEGGTARLSGTTGIDAGHPAAPELLPLDGSGGVWPAEAAAGGEPVCVPLEGGAFAGLGTGAWPESPTQALVVPLLQQGRPPSGFLVAGLNRYRALDDGYRGFIELAAGYVGAGIGSARSYQAQQRRAEELAELDRAKTDFFSNISHEFRTPLTLIMGPVEELRSRLSDSDPRVRQELEAVHRNGLRLGRLVNTLLDFSRIEAGRMQARYEPVDLASVTAELASVFRSAIDKADLGFTVDCVPLRDPVHIDRGMWEKVVLNLLSNALKFTFDGGIRVAVREEDGLAVVTVADSGVGIPADEMPRLFERFHRITGARSRSHEGSGIGLALVQELVGLHGGTIAADSTEGEGTRFTIRLPFGTAHLPADTIADSPGVPTTSVTAAPYVQEALRWLPADDTAAGHEQGPDTFVAHEQGPDAEPEAVGVDAGPASPARVLVVDDNADMREYLTRLLHGAGHEVQPVGDGGQALEAVRRNLPDLIISDVMMPGMDGLSLLNALRTDPRTASVPVLLLSARAGQEASIEGLAAGADDYLVKPFAAAELLARVRANVELARLRTHHLRWRTALVESLQEAFFVCDEHGAVIEINAAFSDILGYGPEDLPFAPHHPWWPDPVTDPEAHQQVAEAFGSLLEDRHRSRTVPVTHRDGRRLWVSATYNGTQDPDTGRRMMVGTFRDVTAEHHAVQRESALASLSTRLSQAGTLPDTLAAALSELRGLWRAEHVLATVHGGGGEPYVTADGAPEGHLPDRDQEAMLAELLRQPLLNPVCGDTGAGIHLEHPDGPMALWIEFGDRRPFSAEDQLLLALLAGRLAQAMTRAHQIDQQRDTALALQRAILGPSRLPDGFAVRYEPATPPLEIGGDWYDIITLPDGRMGIVVGDCVGRGLEAATVMGQLRSACRALFLQDPSPARTLMALDQFAAGIPGANCTTVFCGVLDPRTGRLTYSSAGHPPGVLTFADGTTRLLDRGRSLPLAVRPGTERPEDECPIPARSTLLLYTDGLVERRRRSLDVGIDQAAEALRTGRGTPVEDLATHVMSRLVPSGGFEDDVALLIYRHPAPLEMAFPAESGQLAPVRNALRTWLTRCDLPARTAQDVLIAAGEACANAVEHGHRHSPGAPIRLRAEALTDGLRLTVADTGRWKPGDPAASPHRGRGIAIMKALMHHVTITPGPAGTTVDLHTRIP
ncbi:SpoIIE family protein phosphatase [Streptomyces fructofermentans]|uniref:SpoIIE family protein phosphatase n=1 Tax=Streptomyces fructofermentans TaxID=152141 RepID=UPI003404720F